MKCLLLLINICLIIVFISLTNKDVNALISTGHLQFDQLMQGYLNELKNHDNTNQQKLGYTKPKIEFITLNQLLPEYDFIIAGSGPGGCVLANRLTENRNWTVLLIEAGKPSTIVNDIPLIAAYFQSTDYNWGYLAEKQSGSCWGMENQQCGLPRGKALGGSSVINYMIYNRGNVHDFNRWSEAGNYGWSYAEVLPYFKRSEHSTLHGSKIQSQYHGQNGLLNVEDAPYRTPLVHAFVRASLEAGHREIDYNAGGQQIGVSYVQSNTKRGIRQAASNSFLDPFLNRPNLHILTSSRVTKILIDKQTKHSYGVEYIRNRRIYHVRVRKEVILSAGTFNSPQLLQLSGIGPGKQLKRIGVEQIVELPGVGRNMYDHMSHFGPTFIVNTTGASLDVEQIGIPAAKQLLFHGQGILSVIGGVEALNFVKTPNSREPADIPDVELIFVPGSIASDQGTGLKSGMRISQKIYDQVYKPLATPPIDHWTAMIMLFHPRSKGYLQLKDKNPWHWPKIYPNYFQYDDDVETILHGIRAALKIAEMPAMKEIGARLHDIPLPNCAHLHFGSDDYWRCSIRTLSCTLHHQVGTCKMGPPSDIEAVVDPELRVYGVAGLRVVDTSIIPQPPTSHTSAMSFMIGEKAADMIRSYWGGVEINYG